MAKMILADTIKSKVIPYAGSADLAIVEVEEDSVYPKIKVQ